MSGSNDQESEKRFVYAGRIRIIIILSLWGVSAYFVYRLISEYNETGSKEKASAEIMKVQELDPPWIWISRSVGKTHKCVLTLESCTLFIDADDNDPITCEGAIVPIDVTTAGEMGNLLDSRKLREIGGSMETAFDELVMMFSVCDKETGDVIPSDEVESTCFTSPSSDKFRKGIQPGTPTRVMAIPIGDDTVINTLIEGEEPPERSIGTPLWLGLGSLSSLSFFLQQEVFLNGTTKNTTQYSTSQMAPHPLNLLEFHITPSTFSVTRMMHQPGQSLLDLLGSIFGWLGVDRCVYSVPY
eukprot:TRINITY_DN57_c2_g2_i1.p1 TRINITY_DN57_c2_g2~~TRINITY_DN57_c2_g2_i1.p1  ORF type:complete len:299 (+),score=41.57 TRINITY_DN57_c2_g2_i1:103-999(+)